MKNYSRFVFGVIISNLDCEREVHELRRIWFIVFTDSTSCFRSGETKKGWGFVRRFVMEIEKAICSERQPRESWFPIVVNSCVIRATFRIPFVPVARAGSAALMPT